MNTLRKSLYNLIYNTEFLLQAVTTAKRRGIPNEQKSQSSWEVPSDWNAHDEICLTFFFLHRLPQKEWERHSCICWSIVSLCWDRARHHAEKSLMAIEWNDPSKRAVTNMQSPSDCPDSTWKKKFKLPLNSPIYLQLRYTILFQAIRMISIEICVNTVWCIDSFSDKIFRQSSIGLSLISTLIKFGKSYRLGSYVSEVFSISMSLTESMLVTLVL